MRRANSLDATVLDGASLYDSVDVFGERFARSRVTLDYAKLRSRLDQMRADAGWRPAALNSVLLSIDPNSEGQQRFQQMLSHSGFETDVVHFREAFVSLPPGRSPSEVASKPIVSLAARVTYIAGLMARHTDPHFLVVSHSFELFGPLTDLAARTPRGHVGLAYFGSLLDYRWKSVGLADDALDVKFFDLDHFGDELLGIDLTARSPGTDAARAGLSRF